MAKTRRNKLEVVKKLDSLLAKLIETIKNDMEDVRTTHALWTRNVLDPSHEKIAYEETISHTMNVFIKELMSTCENLVSKRKCLSSFLKEEGGE